MELMFQTVESIGARNQALILQKEQEVVLTAEPSLAPGSSLKLLY